MPPTRLEILTTLQNTVLKISNPIGLYGKIDKILLHDELVTQRPTEVESCGQMFDPNNARYVPAPEQSSHLYCFQCRKRKPRGAFGKDARCINRGGLRTECNLCRADNLKKARLQRRKQRKQAA